jgi:hypothetical protein
MIPGADNGEGHVPWQWNASNKSNNLRYGSLVALSLLAGALPIDIVLPFEVQSGNVVAGPIIGVCTKAGPEPTLSYALPKDGIGVTDIPVASGVGRADFILSPSQTLTQANPYLIPDPAIPGNVIARPVGSSVPPVARALTYPATSASEQYVEGEFMPGLSTGLDGAFAQLIYAEAVDAVVSARFIPITGNHTNPAAAANTPVVFKARGNVRITVPQIDLATAPGGTASDGIDYLLKVGPTPQAANAAAPATVISIRGTATTGQPSGQTGQPTSITIPDGNVLVIATLGVGAGVGSAVHSMFSARAQ